MLGIISLVTLVVGAILKYKEKPTTAQVIADEVEREKQKRLKLDGTDRDVSDYERRTLVQLLLRWKRYKNPPK